MSKKIQSISIIRDCIPVTSVLQREAHMHILTTFITVYTSSEMEWLNKCVLHYIRLSSHCSVKYAAFLYIILYIILYITEISVLCISVSYETSHNAKKKTSQVFCILGSLLFVHLNQCDDIIPPDSVAFSSTVTHLNSIMRSV